MQAGLVLCLLVAVASSKPAQDDVRAASVDAADSATKFTGKSDTSGATNAPISSDADAKPDAGKIFANPGSTSVVGLQILSPGAPDSPEKLVPGKATSTFASPDAFAITNPSSSSSYYENDTKEKLNIDSGTGSSTAEGIASAIDKKKSSASKASDADKSIDIEPNPENQKKNAKSENQSASNNNDNPDDITSDSASSVDQMESSSKNDGNKDSKVAGIGSALPEGGDKGSSKSEPTTGTAAPSKTETFSFLKTP